MITLHRLGSEHARFELNPDLILTVEAHPDTTITLTTGMRLVVLETVAEVVEAVRSWRAAVLADALDRTKASRPFAVR